MSKPLTENQKRDYQKYYIESPTSDFSPEKNKSIIEGTIQKYEKKRADMMKLYREGLSERIDAATDYIRYLERGGSSPAEQYFGKRELARLRGQKIVQTVQRTASGKKIITLSEGY